MWSWSTWFDTKRITTLKHRQIVYSKFELQELIGLKTTTKKLFNSPIYSNASYNYMVLIALHHFVPAVSGYRIPVRVSFLSPR